MIKKKLVVIIALFCLLLTACSEKETTSLTAKKTSFLLALNGSVNIEDYFVQEGNGDLYYAVENPEVLELTGTTLRGKAVGKGAFTVESGSFFIRIEVEVIDNKKITVTLSDSSVEYDGETHLPVPEGDFPEGTSFSYFHKGETFTGAVNAGEYVLSVEVTLPEGYHAEYLKKECVFTVTPKRFNLSDVRFSSKTYTYDGAEKKIEIDGELPPEVTVRYENNVGTDAGIYRAVAFFDVPDEKNYYAIAPENAELIIMKRYINLFELGYKTTTVTYDGLAHSVLVGDGLPSGSIVEYFLSQNGTRTPLSADYSFTDSGEYNIYAAFFLPSAVQNNYELVSGGQVLTFTEKGEGFVSVTDAFIRLSIKKASFIGKYEWELCRGEERKTSVPYGKEISVGGEGEYTLRLVGSSHGVNGEFPSGATITYSTLSLNDYNNVNSGTHLVTARFTMPEGSEKNYEQLSPLKYTLKVDKGVFDMSEVSFKTEINDVTFDPDVKYNDFAVDSSAMENFDENLRVAYSYKLNGQRKTEWKREGEIGSAGEYEIIASFEVICPDKDNYAAPQDMTLTFKINPVYIPVAITFESQNIVYDGLPHIVKVTGEMPEDVQPLYTCGEKRNQTSLSYTDAGEYEVTVDFAYRGWARKNYVLKNGEEEIGKLTAVLTINKATLTSADVDLSGYTQKSVPEYSPELIVADFAINGNENGYVQYKDKDKKIVLVSHDEDHRAYCYLTAIYNPDKKNYNDFEFTLRMEVRQKAIDLSRISVPDQFIAYSAKKAEPVVIHSEAGVQNYITVTTASETNMTDIGKHLCMVTLAVKDIHAYYFVGSNVYRDVSVYIYNSAIYDYAPGTTSLVSYKGSDVSLSLPDGTTGIRAGAFRTSRSPRILVLPDSVTAVAEGALTGANLLESISTPTYFNLSVIFSSSVPTALEEVIVRNDLSVPEKAFSKQTRLKKITYEKAVETVGEYAFENCYMLEEVSFVNVPFYAQNALYDCSSLRQLTVRSFPSAAYYFGSGDKSGYALQEITVTEGTALAENAFKGLSKVKKISLPSTLAGIGARGFESVTATVDLSKTSITEIGAFAFYGFLGEVLLPASLRVLCDNAFAGCLSKTVLMPKNLISIGQNAFADCVSDVVFSAEAMLNSVGDRAFRRYAGEQISLPSMVKTLGDYAFEESNIILFTVPSDMTIGEGCFKNSSLCSLTVYCASIPKDAFYGCRDLLTVELSGTVTIGDNAFYGCGLEEIVFPTTIVSLGESAFLGCPLFNVWFTAQDPDAVPPVKNKIFSTDRAIYFHVPAIALAKYRAFIEGIGCDMTKCTITPVD